MFGWRPLETEATMKAGLAPRARAFRNSGLLAIGLLLVVSVAIEAKSKKRKIEPGPATISDEESEIASDPANGVTGAVILIEEFEQAETPMRRPYITTQHRRAYHRRAKILTEEGVSLAEVEFPRVQGFSKLSKWWGRTILPDGTVRDLPKANVDGLFAKSQDGAESDSKLVLPGVVPGCIIDYGYVLNWMGISARHGGFPIQLNWPIRGLYVKWSRAGDTNWKLVGTDGLDIHVTNHKGALLVTGSDLPAVGDDVGAELLY